MTARSSSTVRVRYAETDQMGVAYHGNYFAWFEVGRTGCGKGKNCKPFPLMMTV